MATKEWRLQNTEKLRQYRREWYARNKIGERNKQVEKNRIRRQSTKSWLKDIKSNLKCSRCPENHPACLQFHHIDPSTKEFSIGDKEVKDFSKEKILKEIQKCLVLCANCHMKEHYVGD